MTTSLAIALFAVDDGRRSVTLSPLFEWYATGFANDLRRRGLPGAGDPLACIAAVASEHDVAFREYDWSLNDAGPDDASPGA